jgi:transposase
MGKISVSESTKWMIIGLYKNTTKSKREIARNCDVSECCVRNTIKNYELTGDVSHLPRTGRPQKLSYRDEHYIYRKVREDPKISYRKLADDFNVSFSNQAVSSTTVRRVLLKQKIESFVALRKPLLTVKDRVKRLKWCKERKYWTVEDWARVIFSDESNFEVFNRKSKVWIKRLASEKYDSKFIIPRLQGGGGSAGIWGCFSYHGTGVCNVYTGRINQHTYINTLENCLFPSATLFYGDNENWQYQQDGAPAHTAHSVRDWFVENNIKVMPWCARSPDLNPIENIWSWMDWKMSKTKFTSVENLKESLQEIWLQVPKETCMKLIESMPKRVRACIKAKGGHFKYW